MWNEKIIKTYECFQDLPDVPSKVWIKTPRGEFRGTYSQWGFERGNNFFSYEDISDAEKGGPISSMIAWKRRGE